MEPNQQILAETGSALGAINSQDGNLNESILDLSDDNLQRYLDSQMNMSGNAGHEVGDRNNPPTYPQVQVAGRTEQTENGAHMGGRQYPPTHTYNERSNQTHKSSMTVMASWAPGEARILAYWSMKETETPGTTWTPVGRQTHLMQNK